MVLPTAPRLRTLSAAVLLASAVLRVALVQAGGQYYWPDERRYEEAQRLVNDVETGRLERMFPRLDSADHLMFKVVGVVPAAIELRVGVDSRIPALFFAGFSLLDIWLIGRIARRLGASEPESVAASALLALSATFFYYARHLVPYDVAMFFALLALYVGVAPQWRARGSVASGALAGCAFLTYAGYWTIGGAALVVSVLAPDGSWASRVRRALWSALGLALVVVGTVAANAALGGHLLESFVRFSRTITEGAYAEGWRLPLEYLWHAERLLLPFWLLAAVCWLLRPRDVVASPRLRGALAGVLFVYGALVVCSVVLERFVVYGRLARQVVPFLCLLAAALLEELRTSPRPWVRLAVPALLVLFAAQTVVTFGRPLAVVFPAEFRRRNAEAAAAAGADRLLWINAAHFHPRPPDVPLPPNHTVLDREPHPLEFLPYQYEGYTPAQRRALRTRDISMRLVVVAPRP